MSIKMEHPFIRSYLDRVCSHVKAKEIHDDVRQEMFGHLEDLVAEKIEREGKSEENAIAEAVKQMGDPDRVGKQLHAAHKPKPEWSVISLVSGMIVVGIPPSIRFPHQAILKYFLNNVETLGEIVSPHCCQTGVRYY